MLDIVTRGALKLVAYGLRERVNSHRSNAENLRCKKSESVAARMWMIDAREVIDGTLCTHLN